MSLEQTMFNSILSNFRDDPSSVDDFYSKARQRSMGDQCRIEIVDRHTFGMLRYEEINCRSHVFCACGISVRLSTNLQMCMGLCSILPQCENSLLYPCSNIMCSHKYCRRIASQKWSEKLLASCICCISLSH